MALTSLPEEVLELVVNKLCARDLIACSGVSIDWRLKFNEDIFWRRFCFKGIKDYLDVIPCVVEPAFEYPESSEYRLQPLCDWRIHFMKCVHLYNNWKMQKFSFAKIRGCGGVRSCQVMVDSEGLHWLFVTTSAEIEVWNVNSSPEYISSIPLFKNCPNMKFFLTGKNFIVTQWNLSSVYDLNSNFLSAVIRFVVEGSEILPENLFKVSKIQDLNFINEKDEFGFTCFGNVFVGFKRNPNPPSNTSMHIWDLISGKKLSTVSITNSLSEGGLSFINIIKVDSSRGLIRHAHCSLDEGVCSQLFEYNFEKLKFSKLNISVRESIFWCGCSQNIIVTSARYPGMIRFYNYFSGKLLSSKEVGPYTNTEEIQLVGSNLLYCMSRWINVMDIHTQEIVYCFEFNFCSLVRHFTVIQPSFVVWLFDRGGRPGCPSYIKEVWDQDMFKDLTGKPCWKLRHPGKLGLVEKVSYSPSLMKQVVTHGAMMYLYTFW